MMPGFPFCDVIRKVFTGSGEVRQGGLDFPRFGDAGMELIWFVLLAVWALLARVVADAVDANAFAAGPGLPQSWQCIEVGTRRWLSADMVLDLPEKHGHPVSSPAACSGTEEFDALRRDLRHRVKV